MVCESFVPDKQYRELRNLIRTRLGPVRTRTTYKNKIYAILAKYEYQSPTHKIFSKKGIAWLRYIALTQTDRMAMDAYLDGMETTQKQIDLFESKMAAISKHDLRVRLLMTIPGINYITALTVISDCRHQKICDTRKTGLICKTGTITTKQRRDKEIWQHNKAWFKLAQICTGRSRPHHHTQ